MEPNINTELAKELVLEARKCYQNKNAQDGLILLEKAKDIFIGARDYEHYIEAKNLMGVIYSAIGNDSMAIDIYLDCLELARKKRLHQYMAISFNNIGSRYQALGQHDKAIEYFLKAQAEMYTDRIPGRELSGSWLLTLYLNIQESYGRLGEYDKALKYLEMARPIMDKGENNDEYRFSFDVMEAFFKWHTNKYDEVYSTIDKLMEEALESANYMDYLQDFRIMCELLESMEEYANWEKILTAIEEYADSVSYVNVKMFSVEMWMKYYKATGDSEKYKQKCVEHADIYFEMQKDEYEDRIRSLDLKIELQQKEKARRLAKHQSDIDLLTGVYTRRKLREDIKKLECSDEILNVCIGIFDIDYFKEKNDTYGHISGDECLRQVSSVIKKCVGGYGSTYRFGGDEFVVIIRKNEYNIIQNIASRIRNEMVKLAIPNLNSKVSDIVTLSAGFKCGTVGEGNTVNELLDGADKCLYTVKRSGKDGYKIEL